MAAAPTHAVEKPTSLGTGWMLVSCGTLAHCLGFLRDEEKLPVKRRRRLRVVNIVTGENIAEN